MLSELRFKRDRPNNVAMHFTYIEASFAVRASLRLVYCAQAMKNLLDIGRLRAEDVDFRPYVVGDTVQLAEVTNGLRTYYYRAPAYGENAQPELARFVERLQARAEADGAGNYGVVDD